MLLKLKYKKCITYINKDVIYFKTREYPRGNKRED